VRFHRGHGWPVQYQHSRIHPLASPGRRGASLEVLQVSDTDRVDEDWMTIAEELAPIIRRMNPKDNA
jgi:hypothetical protein